LGFKAVQRKQESEPRESMQGGGGERMTKMVTSRKTPTYKKKGGLPDAFDVAHGKGERPGRVIVILEVHDAGKDCCRS